MFPSLQPYELPWLMEDLQHQFRAVTGGLEIALPTPAEPLHPQPLLLAEPKLYHICSAAAQDSDYHRQPWALYLMSALHFVNVFTFYLSYVKAPVLAALRAVAPEICRLTYCPSKRQQHARQRSLRWGGGFLGLIHQMDLSWWDSIPSTVHPCGVQVTETALAQSLVTGDPGDSFCLLGPLHPSLCLPTPTQLSATVRVLHGKFYGPIGA